MFDTDQESYISLRDIVCERTRPIVAWIGSGLSVVAGLPTWSLLRDSLCDVLATKIRGMPEDGSEAKKMSKRLDLVRDEDDLWLAFQLLESSLGRASYVSHIRTELGKADSCDIPENYRLIWNLDLSGVFTSNLDRLVMRAYSNSFPGKSVIEFEGRRAGDFSHVLQGVAPFIANLHGITADDSSWVFTHDQLRALLRNEAYKAFVRTVIMARTVVFVGISADDVAVGGHLEALTGLGVSFSSHFWITNRTDIETDRWAENRGIRLITYSRSNDHNELQELLSALQSHLPQDDEPVPVELVSPITETPRPLDSDTLSASSAEELRELLNSHATHILAPADTQSRKVYQAFLQKYDEAIYRAWYVTTHEPKNTLFTYTLIEEIAQGAFGRVFKARRPDGEVVALKLLREDVMNKPGMLQSFRRGVQSMRILSKHNLNGMVAYQEAGEIPSFAVMDLIDGPNLRQAVEAHQVSDWSTILRIATRLATIVCSAHKLPERVLHRDLRPENIMLKDYYTAPSDWEVVVLDFDLSWHIGATELSIVAGESVHGFLAPEQINKDPSISTRNAAVDSFGLGMTLFFLRTGRAPHFLEHEHAVWNDTLSEFSRNYSCPNWRSLPVRFARLVQSCTKSDQASRPDMSQIEGELQRLSQVELNPSLTFSTELLAEEIAVRTAIACVDMSHFQWNADNMEALVDFPSGVDLRFKAMENTQIVELNVKWMSKGEHQHSKVKKFIKPKSERAVQMLEKHGWRNHARVQLSSDSLHFGMLIDASVLRKDIDIASKSVESAVGELKFH